MSRPTVLHNTLVQPSKQPRIDILIKTIFLIESLVAVDRLQLCGVARCIRYFIRLLGIAVCVIMVVFTLKTSSFTQHVTSVIILIGQMLEQFGCVVFAMTASGSMYRFFNEINVFDSIFCKRCVANTNKEKITIIVLFVTFNALNVTSYLLHSPEQLEITLLEVVKRFPFSIVHIMELFFFAYIVSMIYNRLYSINTHLEKVLANNNKDGMSMKINEKMENIMKYYRLLCNAMIYLKNSIKWQLALIVTCAFIVTPFLSYALTKLILAEPENPGKVTSFAIRLLVFSLSLFLPCIACGRMQQQVRRLRTLLATLPCERDLDKRGRVLVREFLTLTEEHDLSLSLFGVLNIDGSIPLQFLSLVLTYHIILLQFEKIIGY